MPNNTDPTPMRRTRSISQSFKNLFRSSSKKKAAAAASKSEPMSSMIVDDYEIGNHNRTNNFLVDDRDLLSTSTPVSKKLSFLRRRKAKQNKQISSVSTNSLSSYDCSSSSSSESVRNTPIRANVGHPVTMTKPRWLNFSISLSLFIVQCVCVCVLLKHDCQNRTKREDSPLL